jgi:hypothetical protein
MQGYYDRRNGVMYSLSIHSVGRACHVATARLSLLSGHRVQRLREARRRTSTNTHLLASLLDERHEPVVKARFGLEVLLARSRLLLGFPLALLPARGTRLRSGVRVLDTVQYRRCAGIGPDRVSQCVLADLLHVCLGEFQSIRVCGIVLVVPNSLQFLLR